MIDNFGNIGVLSDVGMLGEVSVSQFGDIDLLCYGMDCFLDSFDGCICTCICCLFGGDGWLGILSNRDCDVCGCFFLLNRFLS